jgi:ankyrin repeat protein
LKHGARITDRSGDGKISLLYAAANGRLDVVQYLLSLEGGASITETDNKG